MLNTYGNIMIAVYKGVDGWEGAQGVVGECGWVQQLENTGSQSCLVAGRKGHLIGKITLLCLLLNNLSSNLLNTQGWQ